MPVSNRIFLAHASEDKPAVRELYDRLEARGFEPWLDEKDLRAGQIWKIEIPKAINEAGLFLACLSSRSVEKIGYIQNEFRQALSAFGKRPPGSIYLIPVRLDDCEVPDLQIPDLGLSLTDIQWIDLWKEDGFERLVKDLDHALGRPTSSTVPPDGTSSIVSPPKDLDKEQDGQSEKTDKNQMTTNGSIKDQSPYWKNPAVAVALIGASATIIAALIGIFPSILELNRTDEPGDAQIAENTSQSTASSPADPALSFEPSDTFRDCAECPEMVVVPAGSFLMGSPENEEERNNSESPQHWVTIAEPFAIGVYEVTRGQFSAFVSATGYDMNDGCLTYEGWLDSWSFRKHLNWQSSGFPQSDEHPIVCVNWNDARAYVAWLNERLDLPEDTYRLPSEAEWEYAARAGTTTRYWPGDEITPEYANFGKNIDRTIKVGLLGRPNDFGLHDVHGNAWEWVEDCWNDSYAGAPANGEAWATGDCSRRVLRGGTFFVVPKYHRSANRGWYDADGRLNGGGFRVARTLGD